MTRNLPDVVLPSAPTGTAVRLRAGRGPRILLIAHSSACRACRDYLARLAGSDAIREWDGRVSAVVHEGTSGAAAFRNAGAGSPQVLADPGRAVDHAAGSLVIADEWGEVFFTAYADRLHTLPDVAVVAEWARFIAIQCPECEGPEGEWRSL